jgi:serine/threonine-protein kinase
MNDIDFLALLVHRGHLDQAAAQGLLPALQSGSPLDELLVDQVGWSADEVAKLRRTRAGEMPELPGYEVLGTLGAGGTSDVFRVREKKSRSVLALKVLNVASTRHVPTAKAFIAEARLLERLRHENLVEGYGVARSGSTYFSKLECLSGSTLLELLDAGHAFDEDRALRTALQVARAMRYLESEGVVHRDVKPGNIMLTDDGRAVVIDLGFATDGNPENGGGEDSTVGTVQYLSPEQARGAANADSRSDIYSLGISLFQLVVGRLPFESSDDREVLRMQVMDSLSSPELKSRGISPHLHYFIEKMVAKEADHRYQDWNELICDIESQLAGREDLDFTQRSARRGRR